MVLLSFEAATSLRAMCLAHGEGASHAACLRAAFLAAAGPPDVLELAEEQVRLGVEDVLGAKTRVDALVPTLDGMGEHHDAFSLTSPAAPVRYVPRL
jgi:hypothetical protein